MPRRSARRPAIAPPEPLITELVSLVDDAPRIDDPADLELLATTLLLPLDLPELPPAAHAAVVGRLEARRDAVASAVLLGLAAFGTGELQRRAQAAAERLAQRGVAHPAAAHVGELRVEAAGRAADEETELLVAVLERPGSRRRQIVMLGIEHEETGGALIECVLTPPMPAREARAMLRAPTTEPGAPPVDEIDPAELTRRAVAAARRARRVGIALGSDAGPTLPIVSRALTGDPVGLPRPETLPPWLDDDEELVTDDEHEFEAIAERLLDEFEGFVRAGWSSHSAVWHHADAVASSLLQWKHARGDGRLGRWTCEDLEASILHGTACDVAGDADALAAAVPDVTIAFLRFLDARGSLTGEPLELLEAACESLRGHLLERESHRVGGAAKADPLSHDGSPRRSRSAKRKAQRAARRRNRQG